MKFLIIILLFTACHEPTEPIEKVNVQGQWTSREYVLDLQQDGSEITGTATRNKVNKYTISGMSQTDERAFLHLRLLDKELIIFVGNAKDSVMKGTIKENLTVREIEFIKTKGD